MDELTRTPTLARTGAWAVRRKPLPQARLRLLCLPHAGGGAAAFRAWGQRLEPEIEVVPIRLPGRESRFRERPYERLDDLLPPLLRDIAPLLDRPHAWFGHSMGAGIAFELCRAQRRLGLPEPDRLLVAGLPAPHLPRRATPVHDASPDELFARLGELNGTSAEAHADNPMLNVMLPTLRADFAVAETRTHRPGPPLDCPVTVYGGRSDASTTEEELDAWSRHSAASTTVRLFPGGHFFPHDDPDRFLPVLADDLLGRRSQHRAVSSGSYGR
ncbi:thioesterase II family protein [Streptomyces sp. NPDC006641]|uniref:thioesterase II family protein n=1 Tax=unclassified Streptomyces TaxID=2593676 RepID=UPI002E765D50|nr:alpha/beta fold hydrolase [Streptomyces sp. JV184]MEE1748374.1 thioesterase domain-containing protein [Streptomyces sp. JV184]